VPTEVVAVAELFEGFASLSVALARALLVIVPGAVV